ncbi:helix-turn-helix domain-containing protein [Staphylococcus gallinarum]|uniref:helix-turn-helix domain-containing protein n=1 Tax=Staphylococcus gallinarum TaxID=1293 RepID=UPI000D1F2083|nr:helix-turn-helix domain-containing protein [Staphylococcus gallinarum]MCD8786237.1 helix-turn-helix domain-containing protein [Staphylococcus gallinarum]MCD8858797.1 helix-turn-helix domain-containing protein [Staphylococcus gallinarum]PTL16977.1 hypothetical protein BUZ08_08560 [Staphylococcus gallinarum]RIO80243.1 hypothetical protein BUZ07_03270 [Staphylococcus gallinarum]
MQNLFHFIQQNTHHYKTEKSIYNIIIGKKSHQTFFDACSQQLLSLYHSLPNIQYPSFERYYNLSQSEIETTLNVRVHPRYTFDSLVNTFQAIQLLTQTISQLQHKDSQFIPLTQQQTIHKRVKYVYKYLKEANLEQDFIAELHMLFEAIHKENQGTYIHYYLQGFEDSMYTRQQVSLIEGLPQELLFELELNDLVVMMFQIEDNERYPILHQLIVLPTLLHKTDLSFEGLKKGLTMDDLAQHQHVKINTIEDHVLELFIKGYLSNYKAFLKDDLNSDFLNYYIQHKDERLRNYKERFPSLSYFAIKLIIVGIERGELHAD